MTTRSLLAGAAILSVLLAPDSFAEAACPGDCPVPGGGNQRTDCIAEFQGAVLNDRAENPKKSICTDGDPACDSDAVADGVCRCPDECLVTPEGWCEHGLASWALILQELG